MSAVDLSSWDCLVKNLLRRVARRLLKAVRADRRSIAAIFRSAVPSLRPGLHTDALDPAPIASVQMATLLRRIDLLERHVIRETDRARLIEGMRLLQGRRSTIEHAGSLDRLESLESRLERRTSTLAERIVMLQRDLDAHRLVVNELSRDVRADRTDAEHAFQLIEGTVRNVKEIRQAFEAALCDIANVQDSLTARLDGLTGGVQSLEERSLAIVAEVRGLQDGSHGLEQHLRELQTGFTDLVTRHRATPFMTETIFPAPTTIPDPDAPFDYVGFEAIFRGSEELVDLGAGRGEFLELARAAGASPVGVDSNPAMVALCRQRGFDVREADALSYLREAPAASVDLIFSAQFIEHLVPGDLYDLFVAARKALTPGGRMIAETVNPHSIEALKCFYVDLSHIKPLFPEVMLFYARSAGFSDGQIFYPTGGGFDEAEPSTRGEYALIATV
jgi:2-polyprenyl-3-methyl-5-hydroxy-6-metoxy-1,4-benzoquinol methylase/DNA-binding ferritin-like protein